jgi:hypothetical protein
MLPDSLWPLLFRLATERSWPPADEGQGQALVDAATHEGLLPLLFDAPDLPAPVRAALDRRRLWAHVFERRAESLRHSVAEIERLLGESFVLLKGFDYAYRLYPRPALRPMQDIDILVPRARFAAVCQRLRAAGCPQLFPGSPTHRVAWFSEAIFDLGEVTLEVHDSFLPRSRHAIDYEALWARRAPLEAAGRPLLRLSDVDALVYHTLSLAKDEFFARLIRYVDLWRMLDAAPGILEAAAARAREWQTVNAFYGGLQQLQLFFPEVKAAVAPVAEELLPRPARRRLDEWVLPGLEERSVLRPRRRGRQLWRKLWLMDNLSRRTRFGLSYGYAIACGVWLAWRAGEVSKGVDSRLPPGQNTAHSTVRDPSVPDTKT